MNIHRYSWTFMAKFVRLVPHLLHLTQDFKALHLTPVRCQPDAIFRNQASDAKFENYVPDVNVWRGSAWIIELGLGQATLSGKSFLFTMKIHEYTQIFMDFHGKICPVGTTSSASNARFQGIASDARQMPARRNISKSGVRRKI